MAYLRVICQRKELWGEKMRSGRKSSVRIHAVSKIETGYLRGSKRIG